MSRWSHWQLATGTERRALLAYERERQNWREAPRPPVVTGAWLAVTAMMRRAKELYRP